jgi:penicillin amidase
MNLTLALAILAASGGDGWSRLTLGDEKVEVYRDSWGIPHIFARTPRAAFRAEGYTEAEDRLWQMDTLRRAAKGEAAELRGRAGLGNDRDRARRGYTEGEFRKQFESCSERLREALSAYAEGVNDFLREAKSLPPGYARLGVKPRPWTETDSMAIGVMMARRFGEGGDIELTVRQVYDYLVKKKGEADAKLILDDLMRLSDPSAPATLHDHARQKAPLRQKGFRRDAAPGMSEEAFAAYRRELEEIFASRRALGVPVYFGSNAWVVAPKKSERGTPMLYGGPMMGFGTPSICNEIHLVAEGLNVAGMSFPGVPGVMIGWNEHLAWTTTSGAADLVDVYTLELNPENPEEYRYKGAWKRFEILEREIKVRGGDPVRVKVRRSVHGPLVGEPDVKNRRAHTLRMSFWMKEYLSFEAIVDFNFARTIDAFREGARKIATSHNFFCATRDGHIGFWYCGAHPQRKPDHDTRFLQDGGGDMDWEGILPFEKVPQAVDPSHGFFANWNNKPARDWEPSGYGKIFWGKKIIDVLEGQEKIGFERFAEIARLTAYHDFLADYFKPILLDAAGESDDADVKRAVEALREWDNMKREGAIGPVVMERWTGAAARRLFTGVVDPLLLLNRDVRRRVADPMLYTFEGERSIVPLKYDYARGRDLKALAVEALKEVMRAGTDRLKWREPSINFGSEIGRVKSERGRGTYQVAVEMTPEGPRAVTLCAPGQSERPDSPHFKDQIDLFGRWAYKPFLWRRDGMK